MAGIIACVLCGHGVAAHSARGCEAAFCECALPVDGLVAELVERAKAELAFELGPRRPTASRQLTRIRPQTKHR